jgi:hypothetical protein
LHRVCTRFSKAVARMRGFPRSVATFIQRARLGNLYCNSAHLHDWIRG